MKIKLPFDEIRRYSITLVLLQKSATRTRSEADIIASAEKLRWLTKAEQLSVASRSDSRFANWLHNVVSHRFSRRNPIRLGLIEWHPLTSSFSATDKGIQFLMNVASKLGAAQPDDFQVVESWLMRAAKSQ